MIYDKDKREKLIAGTIGLAILSILLAWGHWASWYHKHFWYKTAQTTEATDVDFRRKVKETSRGDLVDTTVRYTFVVDGKDYQGKAEYTMVEPSRNIVVVYFDPRDPSINSIRGPGVKLIFVSGYALLLSISGFLLIFSTLYEKDGLRRISVGALKALAIPVLIPLFILLYKPGRRG